MEKNRRQYADMMVFNSDMQEKRKQEMSMKRAEEIALIEQNQQTEFQEKQRLLMEKVSLFDHFIHMIRLIYLVDLHHLSATSGARYGCISSIHDSAQSL